MKDDKDILKFIDPQKSKLLSIIEKKPGLIEIEIELPKIKIISAPIIFNSPLGEKYDNKS